MIFLGDIANPWSSPLNWAHEAPPWEPQPVIANLEGPLLDEDFIAAHTPHTAMRLYSHKALLAELQAFGVAAVSLANNHIFDYPERFAETLACLKNLGIQTSGAGSDASEAAVPAQIATGDRVHLILSFGWDAIGCRYALPARGAGVNRFEPNHVLSSVRFWRQSEPEAAIILVFHWNYELELYPQPAHRQLAFAAIDEGADVVVAHHPHRVGGIEPHGKGFVAYSLGNWWLPHGIYRNGTLTFPKESCLQLALEWVAGSMPVCHWYEYDPDSQKLSYLESEAVKDSCRVARLTPFRGLDHSSYQDWFSKNRKKRKALPIFRDYRSHMENSWKTKYLTFRHIAITILEQTGLKSLLSM